MNVQEFFNELNANYSDEELGKGETVKNKAYKVYLNALETDKNNCKEDYCIIGKRGDLNYCLSSTVVVKDMEKANVYDGTESNFKKGNSLQTGEFLAEKDWTIVVNDAWLLGSIEAKKTFYLSKKNGFTKLEDVKEVLKPEKEGSPKYPVSVTGRELVGLRAAGYDVRLSPGTDKTDKYLIFEHKGKTFSDFNSYHTNICNLMQKDGKDDFDTCWKNLKTWIEPAFRNQ